MRWPKLTLWVAASALTAVFLCSQVINAEDNPWAINLYTYWADPESSCVDSTVTLGVPTVRLAFEWCVIQWSDSTAWTWNRTEPSHKRYDSLVAHCNREGLRILGIPELTPPWATSADTGSITWWMKCPPREWRWYYTFLDSVVERYDGDTVGSPDPANAGLYRVDYWEVWNEFDNFLKFWRPGQNPPWERISSEYYRDSVLIPAYSRIKQADSTAIVVSSCSCNRDWGLAKTDTILGRDSLYPYLDVVNYHCYLVDPYGIDPADTLGWYLDSLRTVVNSHGLDTIPIWLTEIGWYTWDPNPENASWVPHDTQAVYLLHSSQVWSGLIDSLNLGKFFWYTLKDDPYWPVEKEYRPWGLMDTLGQQRKLSFSAYQDYIRPLSARSNTATAYNGGRKLSRWGENNLGFGYQTPDFVFFASSVDGGDNWTQQYVGIGRFPALASGPSTTTSYLCLVWVYHENEIHYSRYTQAEGWGRPWVLGSGSPGGSVQHLYAPSVVIDQSNVGHMAWEVITDPPQYPGDVTYELHYCTFDATSDEPQAIGDVVLDQASEEVPSGPHFLIGGAVSIALIESQVPCVAWSRPIGEGKYDIYYKERGPLDWPPKPDTVCGSSGLSLHPSLSYNSSAQALDVVWEEEDTEAMFEILHRRKAMGQWTPPTSPSGGWSGDNSRFPVMDGDYCMWSQLHPGLEATEVYYSCLDTVWSKPQNFSETPSDPSDYPHLVYDGTAVPAVPEQVYGIWTDGNSDGYYNVEFRALAASKGGTSEDSSGSHGEHEVGGHCADMTIEIPRVFGLSQNYPNPVNGNTTIRYQLPKQAEVKLEVYNICGQLVRPVVVEEQAPGFYAVNWDGKDTREQRVASGIYFSRLAAGHFTATRKLVVLK